MSIRTLIFVFFSCWLLECQAQMSLDEIIRLNNVNSELQSFSLDSSIRSRQSTGDRSALGYEGIDGLVAKKGPQPIRDNFERQNLLSDDPLYRIKAGDSLLIQFVRLPAKGISENTDRQIFPSKGVYKVDYAGFLHIPNVQRFSVAGLNSEMVATRISVSSLFENYEINVSVLPLVTPINPFGQNIFNQSKGSDGDYRGVPVSADYKVGAGDQIHLLYFGKKNKQFLLTVKQNGQLFLPDIGPITVSGLTFSQLKEEITLRVKQQFIGVSVSATLEEVKPIKVFVLGEVEKPGAYVIRGNATLFDLLQKTGGVLKSGGMRNVEIKGVGRTTVVVDLYETLLFGKLRNDLQLNAGDTVFVPVSEKLVGIMGQVKRPAYFELKPGERLADLLKLAGGALPDAYLDKVIVNRQNSRVPKKIIDIDLRSQSGKAFDLMDGDLIQINPNSKSLDSVIGVFGFVKKPGLRAWTDGMRLSDIDFTNVVEDMRYVDADYVLISRRFDLSSGMTYLSGKITSGSDPRLMPEDNIYFFDRSESRVEILSSLIKEAKRFSGPDQPSLEVDVTGMVHFPGTYPLTKNMTVNDLLDAAGGLLDRAFVEEAELHRLRVNSNGERVHKINLVDLAGQEFNEDAYALQAYDQLHVRKIPGWEESGVITLKGEFRFPGEYSFVRGESLKSVILRAGGLNKDAFPEGAVFVRESVRQREQENLDQLYSQLQLDLDLVKASQQSSDHYTVTQGEIISQRIRATKAMGRMVISLQKILNSSGKNKILVQDQDVLVVPQKLSEVTVIGEVYHPTSHFFDGSLTKTDYIKLSGGVTDLGNKNAVYVVHVDGAVTVNNSFFSRRITIGPGDTIVVPPEISRVDKMKLYTDISQILYQLAVTTATLKVLNIF